MMATINSIIPRPALLEGPSLVLLLVLCVVRSACMEKRKCVLDIYQHLILIQDVAS